jgi:hypothetical protein
MAKYIKHYYVDGADLTTFLTTTNTGTDGKTHPPLDGLDVKFWFHDSNGIDYCLSQVPDATAIVATTGLEEMAYAVWAADAAQQFDQQKQAASQNAELLAAIEKTAEQVLAMTFDTSSTESMLASFAQLARPANTPPV